jgi:hypothetical protein
VLRVNRIVVAAVLTGGGLALIAVPLVSAASSVIQSQICLPFGTPTITTPAQDYTTQTPSATMSGTADPNAVVSATDNGTGDGVTTADSTGAYSISLPLSYGSNVLQTHVTNACDTVNSSNTVTITRPAPVVPPTQTTTSPPEPTVSNLQPVVEPTSQNPTSSVSSGTPEPTQPYSSPIILAPLSGLVVTTPYALLTGEAIPGTAVQVLVNGQVVAQVITASNGIFSVSVSLVKGINSLTTQITTNAGTFTSKPVIVNYAPVHISNRGIIARTATIGGALAIATGGGIAAHAVLGRAGFKIKLGKRKR